MIEIKDIRKLQNIFSESDIGEIEIRHGKDAVKLTIASQPSAEMKRQAGKAETAAAVHAGAQDALRKAAAEKQADSQVYELRSQWIGYFTRLNSKSGENYIKLRDVVKKGDLVGHVRVLGVLQDIKSEVNGKVKEVLVEEGQPIEYGQPVMRFEIKN
ncbi:MAG: biotin/lipoyl-containing protein [Brevinematales bacterium]|jgi:acetyl-CoA carboxylase biotin carboxyl carrier protein